MKNKIIITTILILAILAGGFWYSQNSQNKVVEHKKTNQELAQEWVKKGNSFFDEATAETYNVQKADEAYHKALELNPNDERALFQATRIKYVQGRFDDADRMGAEYIKKFPNKKRIHYILGLNDAYAGKFDPAADHFHQFINSGESTNAGYLDLAWVYFQKGDYETAKKYIEEGIEKYGDNAWLNLSLAMNKFNLGEDKKEIFALLDKAEKQANELTPEKWKISYSSNNPKGYKDDIQKLKDIISINKKIVKGESVNLDLAKLQRGLQIEALSPKGVEGGYTVSACCDSNEGKSCDGVANACGMYRKGKIKCDGDCSASKPSDDYCPVVYSWTETTPLVDQKITDCEIDKYGDWKVDVDHCIAYKTNKGKVGIYNYHQNKVESKTYTKAGKTKPSNVIGNGHKDKTNSSPYKDKTLKTENDNSLRNTISPYKSDVKDCKKTVSKPLCEVFPNNKECGSGGKCHGKPPICKDGKSHWLLKLPYGNSLNDICTFDTATKIDLCYLNSSLELAGKKKCNDDPTGPEVTAPTQGEVGIEKSWSLNKAGPWNPDFSHVILLKTANTPIYFKVVPESEKSCRGNAEWGFNFTEMPLPWDSHISEIVLQNSNSPEDVLSGAGKILTLKPTSDAKTDYQYTQTININYCGGDKWEDESDKTQDIKFKIVNIEQQET